MYRIIAPGGGWIVSTLLCALWVAVDAGSSGSRDAPPAAVGGQRDAPGTAATEPSGLRLREGELLENQVGVFEVAGERIRFVVTEPQRRVLPVLENLALERVMRVPQQQIDAAWLVTGTVTEYRGRNYLLIERAVVRAVDPRAAGSGAPPLRS